VQNWSAVRAEDRSGSFVPVDRPLSGDEENAEKKNPLRVLGSKGIPLKVARVSTLPSNA
jgi:hypothetical protein